VIRVNLLQTEKPATIVQRSVSAWTPGVVLLILCVLMVLIMLAVQVVRSIRVPNEMDVDVHDERSTLSQTLRKELDTSLQGVWGSPSQCCSSAREASTV
jgi:uncharacterized membrane protein